MYNKLALITGFPEYTNDTDTPETNQFLLETLSEALMNIIDNIYTSQNVLERVDTIKTTPGKEHYEVEGYVKSIMLTNPKTGKTIKLPFNDRILDHDYIDNLERIGVPQWYVMDKGRVRVYPVPNDVYTLRVTVSTTDLVDANDDSSRATIEDVADSVIASNAFCELVVLRAAAFVFARVKNPLQQYYQGLYDQRLKNFLERDNGSQEARRVLRYNKGHYNPIKGLLDD